MERLSGNPIVTTARVAGLSYLLTMALGGAAGFVRRGLVVQGDAVATAVNIMAHQSTYLLAYAIDILFVASYVVVVALFYRLFKPASKDVAITAACFGLGGCIILAIGVFFELAPLVPLKNSAALTGFTTRQLQSLSYMLLKLYAEAYAVSLAFFAIFMILTGYTIYRSTYVPRVIGAMFTIGGFAWLTFLYPPFGQTYLAYIVPFSISEVAIALWLLIKAVDVPKWNAKVLAAGL